jgi:hypothetical protein
MIGKRCDKILITLTLVTTQLKIAVKYGEIETKLMQQVHQYNGVNASTAGNQHMIVFGKELLLFNEFIETKSQILFMERMFQSKSKSFLS